MLYGAVLFLLTGAVMGPFMLVVDQLADPALSPRDLLLGSGSLLVCLAPSILLVSWAVTVGFKAIPVNQSLGEHPAVQFLLLFACYTAAGAALAAYVTGIYHMDPVWWGPFTLLCWAVQAVVLLVLFAIVSTFAAQVSRRLTKVPKGGGLA